MRHYRVPFRLHDASARTKAAIATKNIGGCVKPDPAAEWVEFDAPTHGAAERVLRSVIRTDDPRPIRGSNWVSMFMLERELTADEVKDAEAMVGRSFSTSGVNLTVNPTPATDGHNLETKTMATAKKRLAKTSDGRKLVPHDGSCEYFVCRNCEAQIDPVGVHYPAYTKQQCDDGVCPQCGSTDTAWLFAD